jgi:hypothetical protein
VTHVIASRNNRLRLASRQAIASRVARRSEMGAHPPGGSP